LDLTSLPSTVTEVDPGLVQDLSDNVLDYSDMSLGAGGDGAMGWFRSTYTIHKFLSA